MLKEAYNVVSCTDHTDNAKILTELVFSQTLEKVSTFMLLSEHFEPLASLVADSLQVHVKRKEGKNYVHYRRNKMLTDI